MVKIFDLPHLYTLYETGSYKIYFGGYNKTEFMIEFLLQSMEMVLNKIYLHTKLWKIQKDNIQGKLPFLLSC